MYIKYIKTSKLYNKLENIDNNIQIFFKRTLNMLINFIITNFTMINFIIINRKIENFKIYFASTLNYINIFFRIKFFNFYKLLFNTFFLIAPYKSFIFLTFRWYIYIAFFIHTIAFIFCRLTFICGETDGMIEFCNYLLMFYRYWIFPIKKIKFIFEFFLKYL